MTLKFAKTIKNTEAQPKLSGSYIKKSVCSKMGIGNLVSGL